MMTFVPITSDLDSYARFWAPVAKSIAALLLGIGGLLLLIVVELAWIGWSLWKR